MSTSRPSVADLRRLGQPPGWIERYSGEHWAGRLYARRVSPYVTWALVRTPLSANAITILMGALGVLGAGFFAFRGLLWPVIGALLIQVYLILDCSDGEVARWRGTTGATGIFLDRLGHYAVEASLFAAMGARAAFDFDNGGWFAMGLVASLLHVLGKAETDLVHVARAKAGLEPAADEEHVSLPQASGLAAFRRAARAFPIYRLTGAIEASLLALVLIVIGDRWADGVEHAFVPASVIVTGIILVGHLVMILASNRLR